MKKIRIVFVMAAWSKRNTEERVEKMILYWRRSKGERYIQPKCFEKIFSGVQRNKKREVHL